MSKATTHPVPSMPAWATHREDINAGKPSAFTQFTAALGGLTVRDGDHYTDDDEVTLQGRAYSTAAGDMAPMEPIIEVWNASYGNVVFSLTAEEARALSGLLSAAADRISGEAGAGAPTSA